MDEFEKLLNDLGKKLQNYLNNRQSPGLNKPDNIVKYIIIAIAVLIGLSAVLSSYYTVNVSEEAVVTRFGSYVTTTNPGLHFKLPFGIDREHKVETKRALQEEFGFRKADTRDYSSEVVLNKESLMLTGDLNVVDVQWAVQYRIKDAWKFLFHARDVRRTIRDISMSIMRRVVGDRLAGEVLTTGRVEIAADAKKLMQQLLDEYDLGIHIDQVILQDVNPPDLVKPAFNEVNEAKQEQEQAINNAERQYNKIIPEARGKAEQLIADAQAFAIDKVNSAEGDAKLLESIIKEYLKAPQITKDRIYIETMEKLLKNKDSVIIIDDKVHGLLPMFNGILERKQK